MSRVAGPVIRVFFSLMIGCLLAGNGSFAQITDSSARGRSTSSFIDLIHPGDVIDIHVNGYLEFDWRGGLSPEGFLDGYDKVPGQVFAQCKSEKDLAKAIDKMLSEVLREPKTEVRIVDRSKRPFATIDGAVKTPLRVQFRRMARLSELIVSAGGFTDKASGRVMISRPPGLSCIDRDEGGTGRRFDIEISDILAGKPEANPIVASGDLVVVIDASPVFLLGAVQTQGRIDFRSDLSVSRAIDAVGGLMKNAVPGEVKIFRRDGGSAVIPVDIDKIRNEKAEDVILRPYDIIDVPFKGKPPRRLPPIIDSEAEAKDRRSKLPVAIIE